MNKFRFLPLILLAAAASAAADPSGAELDTIAGSEAPGEYDQGFSGSVSLGYTATGGNTETSSLDARAGIAYGAGQWYHVGSIEKIRATEGDRVTASSAQAEAQSDYLFTPNNYGFAHLGYASDEFGGIERRMSETVGYGRRLLHTPAMTWSAQIGVGARQEDVRLTTTGGTYSRNSAIVQLGSTFSWQFSENSSFGEGVVVERGSDSTRIESATTLTVKMMNDLSLVLAYTIKHNTEVPPPAENTDTYTSVSIQYTF